MVAAAKERLIVTGAAGLLGSALCKYFENKYDVIGLTHQECDITDEAQVEEKIIKQNPRFLINPAGFTFVDECEKDPRRANKVNIEGPKNLAEGCKKIDCLMVQISTDYVFDGEKSVAYTEQDQPNPVSVYAQTKLEGEKAAEEILSRFFIVRTSWLFGKKGRDFVSSVIERIDKKIPLKIIDDKFSIPTYNFDLAKAIGDLINKVNDYGIYHITNSGSCSWYDFAKEVAKNYLGKDIKIEPVALDDFAFVAKRPRNTVLENMKFHEALGYKLRPWQEALKEYIDKCYKN